MGDATVRSCLLVTLFAIAICEPLRAADDQVRVVSASELKVWWQADPTSPNSPPRYPVDALKDGGEGCVAVAFEIHSDGSVSNERVWHSVLTDANSSKELKQAALLTVHQWRFAPAATNAGHASVYTYAVVTFTLSEGYRSPEQAKIKDAEFKSKCEMSDFPQQVQAMINSAANAKSGTQ